MRLHHLVYGAYMSKIGLLQIFLLYFNLKFKKSLPTLPYFFLMLRQSNTFFFRPNMNAMFNRLCLCTKPKSCWILVNTVSSTQYLLFPGWEWFSFPVHNYATRPWQAPGTPDNTLCYDEWHCCLSVCQYPGLTDTKDERFIANIHIQVQ